MSEIAFYDITDSGAWSRLIERRFEERNDERGKTLVLSDIELQRAIESMVIMTTDYGPAFRGDHVFILEQLQRRLRAHPEDKT